jgi:hypothetical protein
MGLAKGLIEWRDCLSRASAAKASMKALMRVSSSQPWGNWSHSALSDKPIGRDRLTAQIAQQRWDVAFREGLPTYAPLRKENTDAAHRRLGFRPG